MPLIPIPSTTHGRAFGIYGETIAIRWARSLVDEHRNDFQEIAEKIRSRIADEGGGFIASVSVEYRGREIGFWANPHEASGCYLVNAFLKIPGVFHPIPAMADVLQNDGWDLLFEGDDDDQSERQDDIPVPDYENINELEFEVPEHRDVRTYVANTKGPKRE